MVSLVNPYTGKTVEAAGDVADRLARSGFVKVEPVAEDAPKRPGRPKRAE